MMVLQLRNWIVGECCIPARPVCPLSGLEALQTEFSGVGAPMARQPRRRSVNNTGRSRRGATPGGQFVPISHEMAHSTAWRSLKGTAVKVYIELRSRFNGFNNGDLSLSLEQAASLLHIGKATAQRAFRELEDKGFIEMRVRGHWWGRRATTYSVTDRPMGNNQPTNRWRTWRPPTQIHSAGPARTDQRHNDTEEEPSA